MKRIKIIISLLLLFCMVVSFFSCIDIDRLLNDTEKESETKSKTEAESISQTVQTPPETTSAPQTTTAPDTQTTPVETEFTLPMTDGGYEYLTDVRAYLPYIDVCGGEFIRIASRKHPVGKDYEPKDLMSVGNSKLLRENAKNAFEAMRNEMRKLGKYDTSVSSTYRSYSKQNTLYNKYIERERKKYPDLSTEELMKIVDTYSAKPGTSDHQLGMTIDFYPLEEHFENTKAFKYMKDNAHKFGFILRYPEGKENITGYQYEPWHWRFVGRDAASYMYENNIATLEEYVAYINGTEVETYSP